MHKFLIPFLVFTLKPAVGPVLQPWQVIRVGFFGSKFDVRIDVIFSGIKICGSSGFFLQNKTNFRLIISGFYIFRCLLKAKWYNLLQC